MANHFASGTCTHDGCGGVRLPTGGRCWAHAADLDLNPALKQLSEDGRLDARRVPIAHELLERLLAAAPKGDQGRPVLTDARFGQAAFQEDIRFDRVSFQGTAEFTGASFQGDAWFESATFQDAWFGQVTFHDVWFREVSFHGNAWFQRMIVQGDAWFDRAIFRDAWFSEVTFQEDAWFRGVSFHGDAWFDRATFQDAWFDRATFQGASFGGATFQNAWFGGATFQGHVRFDRATFQGGARFGGASFERARQLGPMLIRRSLVLDLVVFHERVQIEVAAAAVCCQRARFLAGVHLGVRWARVVLDDADLAAPSLVAGIPDPFPHLEEGRWVRALERLKRLEQGGPRGSRPRLVSVRRADVAGLTVARVDLRACRFVGAHHLDQLRVEECDFPVTPKGRRWTTRQAIAEEHHWRHTRPDPATAPTPHTDHSAQGVARAGRAGRRTGWYQPSHRPPAWLEVERPTPAQIAAAYRALRKGREDNKDEPGAADFYYGEMEMRRHAKRAQIRRERRRDTRGTASTAAIEYAILWLYWAVSGYGLRAWRALATLAAVVLLAGGIFAFWGFNPPTEPAFRIVDVGAAGAPIYQRQPPPQRPAGLDELPGAVRFSAQAATALLRGPDRPLTALGEWLHMALRLVGPVLLGLAVLSIRGRVKR